MKTRSFVLIIIGIFCLQFSTAFAGKQEDLPVEIVSKMSELLEAKSGLESDLVLTLLILTDLLKESADIEEMRKSKDNLQAKFNRHKTAAQAVNGMLADNKLALKSWDGYQDLVKNTSNEEIEEIEKYVNHYAALIDSLKVENFSVYATEDWANSGMNVSEGDFLIVEAEGQWTVSKSNWPMTTWPGYPGNSDTGYTLNKGYPLGALLYRVRGSSNQLGSGFIEHAKGLADATGRLEFIINDNSRGNNDGQLNLKIYVFDGSKLDALIKILAEASEKKKQS